MKTNIQTVAKSKLIKLRNQLKAKYSREFCRLTNQELDEKYNSFALLQQTLNEIWRLLNNNTNLNWVNQMMSILLNTRIVNRNVIYLIDMVIFDWNKQ